jgi:hypothetical protein
MRVIGPILIAVLFLASGTSAATAGGAWQVLKLEITSGLGPITVYVSDKSAKVVYDNLRFTVVCSAPNFDVSAYSDVRKNVCTVSHSVFMKRGITMVGQIFAGERKFLTQGIQKRPAEFRNLKCTCYQIPIASDDGSSMDTMDILYSKSASDKRQSCQLISTADPPPAEISSMLSRLLHVPSTPGVPIECSYRWSRGSTWSLRSKGWSKVPTSPDFFKVPRGYAAAKSFEDVQYSASSKSDVEDAFKDLGLGGTDKPRK